MNSKSCIDLACVALIGIILATAPSRILQAQTRRLRGGKTELAVNKAVTRNLSKAQKLVEQGKFTQAINELKKLMSIAPDVPDVYLELGSVYHRTGIHELASKILEPGIAVAQQASYPAAFIAQMELVLAQSLLAQNDQEKASGYLLQAAQRDPENPEPWRLMAKIQMQRRQARGAMASLQEVLKRTPDDLPVVKALARLALQQQDKSVLLETHRALVRLAPNEAKALRGVMAKINIRPPEPLPIDPGDPYAGARDHTQAAVAGQLQSDTGKTALTTQQKHVVYARKSKQPTASEATGHQADKRESPVRPSPTATTTKTTTKTAAKTTAKTTAQITQPPTAKTTQSPTTTTMVVQPPTTTTTTTTTTAAAGPAATSAKVAATAANAPATETEQQLITVASTETASVSDSDEWEEDDLWEQEIGDLAGYAENSAANVTPPTDSEIRQRLEQLFADDEDSRQQAQDAFVAWGEAVLPTLEEGLDDPDPEKRIIILKTLGQLGPKARKAYPSIQEAVNDPDPAVQDEAEKAIERLMDDY